MSIDFGPNFIQSMCAKTRGSSVVLLYLEAMLFTSIFWSNSQDNLSILGAIPSVLLSGLCKDEGFCDVATQLRSRLNSASCTTCSDYRYLIFCHDLLCSLAANHNDMRLFGKGGMTAADDSVGGLDLRGKEDSDFLHSIDSRQMVKNLCSSQEYYEWDVFLTFTCNMRKHFGTRPIREWLDNDK